MTDPDSRGIPRPYSSTDIPTPRRVLQRIFSPIELWVVTLIMVVMSSAAIAVFTLLTSFSYNSIILLVSAGVAVLSILMHSEEPTEQDVRSVPSIKDVSLTTNYVKLSSRIVVVTLISGILAITAIVAVHMVDVNVNPITRLSAVLFLLLGFGSSYLISNSLCSYSAQYENSRLSALVDTSSLPEVVTFLGFIIPPILVVYTGFFYTQPAFITIPFDVSIIDSLSVSLSLYILYFSVVSRL